ncbi:MAG: SMC-Scp complex subunit ScpB [Patescibacteria group bacterium]
MELARSLEALLFISGEPVARKDILRLLACDTKTLDEAIIKLSEDLQTRGIRVLQHEDTITLATAPENSEIVEKITREQLEGDLSRSALETLAIILWKGKVSRSGIDYIRGVNSAFALRALLIRGLVERSQDEKDARVYIYRPTIDVLKFLGITSLKDLPEIETLSSQMKEYD